MRTIRGEVVLHTSIVDPEKVEAQLDYELVALKEDLLAQYRAEMEHV